MELIYAAMLLHKAHKEINGDNIKKLLHSVGIEKTDGEIKALVSAMTDVDIEKAIKEAAVPLATSSHQPTSAAKVEKKEEPKEDPEKAAAGLSALFG